MVQGDHLKLDWVRPLNLACEKEPVQACTTILRRALELKQRISYERSQQVLRLLQAEFGGEISLVEPNRTFVREGRLTKISSGNKKQEYIFFLFSDLIIYGSDGIQSRFRRLVGFRSDFFYGFCNCKFRSRFVSTCSRHILFLLLFCLCASIGTRCTR